MANRGHWSWPTRAAAVAGVSAIALVTLFGAGWDPFAERTEPPEPGPAVATAVITPLAPATPNPLPGNDSSIARETRHLILTGTHVGQAPADSRAFMGTEPRNPQTYALNAMLVNGTRITAIARDHILLERDGQVARLEIGGSFSEPSKDARRLTTIAVADADAKDTRPTELSTLTDVLGASPEFDANGMLTSYRLRPGRYPGVFARWGLQRGDRLILLEGAPLADTDSAAFMLGLVEGGERLQVTIIRNGVRMPVVLDGALLQEEIARLRAEKDQLGEASG